MGRRISFIDRDDIDRIVAAMPRHETTGLRELIQQVVDQRAIPIRNEETDFYLLLFAGVDGCSPKAQYHLHHGR